MQLAKISNWFWDVIEKAETSQDKLRSILFGMEKEEVYRFQDEFLEAAAQLRDAPFSDIVYADGESEDGLQDVSNWVVRRWRGGRGI